MAETLSADLMCSPSTASCIFAAPNHLISMNPTRIPQTTSDATLEPRSFPEIINLIVEELGNPDARAEVARAIEHSFNFFRRCDPWFARAGKAVLADDAKGIADSIAAFEAKLAAASPLLDDFLFTPPWARGKAISAADLLALQTTCREAALEPLRRIRRDCERIRSDEAREREQQPRRHGPEIDRAQRHCAILAYDLMGVHSERPITGSSEGHYCSTASLLFEALTDQAEVDLKRHCNFVMKVRPRLVSQPNGYKLPPRKRRTCP